MRENTILSQKRLVEFLLIQEGIANPIIDECHELYGHGSPLKCMRMLSETFHYPRFAKGGFQYILFTIDSFRKFVRLYTLRIATTKAEILKLSSDYFPKYGKPERIICDHGTQFTSKKWLDIMARDGI